MSTRRRLVGIAAATAGTAVAGGTAAVIAQRRAAVRRRRRQSSAPDEFGTLHSDAVQVVTGDGISLHAEVDEPDGDPYEDPAGSPADPTIVFVHGYALNLDCWHFQREHFRGEHRLVFYDQRSHGRSERSPVGKATIDQLGHDLRSVLDQLVPEGPVVLVGHSMGGMTIMSLADQHPELFGDRVVGVGLVSTSAGGLKTHKVIGPFLPERLMRELTPRAVALLARAPGVVDGARRSGSDLGFFLTSKIAFGSEEVPTPYVEFVDEMLMQTPFEVIAEFFPNFDALDKWSVLHAFEKVPTTIICGTEDVLTSIGHSRKLASRIQSAQLLEIPRSGHMVILEHSRQVNTALDRMVAEASARTLA